MTQGLVGWDIGGTKCAVVLGSLVGDDVRLIDRRQFPTPPGFTNTVERLNDASQELIDAHRVTPAAIGVACGGPLNTHTGRILSPPNLPGWDDVDLVTPLRERWGVPVALENDANAGALAEWRWGGGRGLAHVIFLTFGTGMGAGLILNGRLYRGTRDLAGEIGHLRLAESGPVGFGKAGSFEGFCSGGGIARLAAMRLAAWRQAGKASLLASEPWDLSAERVGWAAQTGDVLACAIWEEVGRRLGQGLAVLIDVLNPQLIALGSIYRRQQAWIEPAMRRALAAEAIAAAYQACRIEPTALGEAIGDWGSLAVAYVAAESRTSRP